MARLATPPSSYNIYLNIINRLANGEVIDGSHLDNLLLDFQITQLAEWLKKRKFPEDSRDIQEFKTLIQENIQLVSGDDRAA